MSQGFCTESALYRYDQDIAEREGAGPEGGDGRQTLLDSPWTGRSLARRRLAVTHNLSSLVLAGLDIGSVSVNAASRQMCNGSLRAEAKFLLL